MSELLLIKYLPSNLTLEELLDVLGPGAFHCYGSQRITRNLDNRRYAFVRILSHLSHDDVVEKLNFLDALGQSAYVDLRKFTFTGWVSGVTERESTNNRDKRIYRNKYYSIDSDKFDQPLEIIDFNLNTLGVYGLEVGQLVEFTVYEKETDPSEHEGGEAALNLNIADMTNLFCGSIIEKGVDWLVAFETVGSLLKIAGAYGVTERIPVEVSEAPSKDDAGDGATAMAILSRSQKARLLGKGATAGDSIWLPIFASGVICQAGDCAIHEGAFVSLTENVSSTARSDENHAGSRPSGQSKRDHDGENQEKPNEPVAAQAARDPEDADVRTGAIKFINLKKNIGFIAEDKGGDIFIPPPIVKGIRGLRLETGTRVSYRTYTSDKDGRPCAREIRLLK